MRLIICPVCSKEWQLRNGMAYQSLIRHIKDEHKEKVKV
jgi:hypothetical protein